MKTTSQQLKKWIRLVESERIEFKQAGRQFDFVKLTRYCVALANEGGGKLILGVTDKPPRKVAGTEAFPDVGKTQAQLLDRLHLRIDMEEIIHPDGRIVVVHVPSRPIGRPVEYRGAYWMRSHDALVPMTPEKLQQIFAEAEPDFSAQICKEATIGELDHHAIQKKHHCRFSSVRNIGKVFSCTMMISGIPSIFGTMNINIRMAFLC